MKFRTLMLVLVCCLVLVLSGCGSNEPSVSDDGGEAAPQYPEKTINVIIGYAAGGSTDMTARPAAEAASKLLNRPVVIVNRPGAGGSVGLSEVVRSNPDGYTIAITSIGPTTIVPYTTDVGYTYEDLIPIAQLTDQPLALAVHKDSPYQTLDDFVEYAKANPGKITYATPGTANVQHITALRFERAAGIELTQVPFEGAAPAVAALLGQNIDAAITSIQEVASHYDSGEIRVLGVTSAERETLFMPEAPTFKEQGYDVEAVVWYGVLGPKGMPEDIVNILSETFENVGTDPAVTEAWKKLYLIPSYANPEDFGARIQQEAAVHEELLKELNLSQ